MSAARVILVGIAVAVSAFAGPVAAQHTANPHGPRIGACAGCHAPESWKPAKVASSFRHAEQVFPLTGAHVRTTCTSCHRSLEFSKVTATCGSCHTDVHRGEVGTDCARCHTTRSFVDVERMRKVHELSRFPLRGAHATAGCSSCHVPSRPGQAQFAHRPTACVSCHLENFRRARFPDHSSAGFPTDCAGCHSVATWLGARFDHSRTNFPLDGAHRAATCSDCHANRVYRGTAATCSSCHLTNFARTTSPPHAAAGFGTNCVSCHNTTKWAGTPFNHATTRFPLTARHATASCAQCHGDGVYRGKPTTCVSCHQGDYARAAKPSHAGFPTTCESCHSPAGWSGAAFDHSATSFPLAGAHRTVSCNGCHADGVYRGKPTTCVSCHQSSFAAAARPPHASLGFSAVCLSCHTMAAWKPASYDHGTTRFALTGAHRAATCTDCHGDNVYRGKPMTCVSCHLTRYQATRAPAHAAAGFPTTCESCHTTGTWSGAVFNHATTRFPLTGAHTATSCSACHGDGVYRGKPLTCAGCHLAKYSATTRPSHTAARFPTTCESCHSTATWLGARFDHDASFFPIYSGAHQGKWSSCAECHTVPTNYSVFTCTSCHSRQKTDGQHQGRTGYSYDSIRCYSCHPRGKS